MAIDQVKLNELVAHYRDVMKRWQELLANESKKREEIKPQFAKDQGAELREALRDWAVESGERAKQTATVEELKEAERKLFFYVLNNTEDPVTEAEMRLIVEDYAERITYLKKTYLLDEEEEKKEALKKKPATKKKAPAKKETKTKAAKKESTTKKATAKKAPAKKTTKKKETPAKEAKKPAAEKKATAAKKDKKKAASSKKKPSGQAKASGKKDQEDKA